MNVFRFNKRNGLGSVSVSSSVITNQTTIAESVRLTGTGLHSGGETSVIIHPAGEDLGIVFSDSQSNIVRALASNVVDTSRGTTIGLNGVCIRTIEHLMSALSGMGIDNAIIEVLGPEMPALDGSALPYVEAIEAAGVVELNAPRRLIRLTEPVCVRQNGSFIVAVPAPKLSVTYVLNYDHPMIGSQTAGFLSDETDFGKEIAPARTFVLYEEVAGLLNDGLSQGGSIDNVIVIWQDHLSSDLRFPDELVRHKVMDMIGDLSLAGGRLQAEVLAVKSGHTLNVEFAKEIERMFCHSEDSCLLKTAG
ncbi:MAG: UDP-3-O-acyl-N-acetylglucosamine deacetylase [Armatimonadota bacterium]|nr:UDP-3-O-acyl-N-acetylglucosamine deacetylase [bacterium]